MKRWATVTQDDVKSALLYMLIDHSKIVIGSDGQRYSIATIGKVTVQQNMITRQLKAKSGDFIFYDDTRSPVYQEKPEGYPVGLWLQGRFLRDEEYDDWVYAKIMIPGW